jgi:type II secretion system protein G
MRPDRSAFTLIELLIVVAIIAILAAIAVPNFLEAQTRSKVSRAVVDMRSVANALESFRVDRTDYPVRAPDEFSALPALIRLTTPVAYMTRLPEDVFAQSLDAEYPPAPPLMIDWLELYRIEGVLTRPFTFDYQFRNPEDADWSFISSHPNSVRWALRSVGPDNVPVWLNIPPFDTIATQAYDPTNGTTSAGLIYYTGPGIGLDRPSAEIIPASF